MKTRDEIQSVLNGFLDLLALPSGVERELSFGETESRSVGWADGKPSLIEAASAERLGVRVLEDGRQGTVSARSLSSVKLPGLAAEALAIARATPPDPNRRMARAAPSYPAAIPIDNACFQRPTDEIQTLLSAIEKEALKVDRRLKKVVKFQFTERKALRALANSHLPAISDESTASSFVAEILAEDHGRSEVAWDFQSRRFLGELDIEGVAMNVANHAAASLGGAPVASGKYAIVIDPRVGVQLLDLVTQAISAEAVQRGRSFLKGELDKAVASPLVTIIDDPFLPQGVASESFDDEGTPHERLEMISGGVLMDYFYDLRSAAADKRASNGHGGGPTNFFIKPGATPVADMLGSAPHVFLLKDVMGLHMADPISGEFSLGASGMLYEKGRVSRAVRGVTIAGTVASMLKGVSAVGPDLTWFGSTGAPSFLLPSVTVAGN